MIGATLMLAMATIAAVPTPAAPPINLEVREEGGQVRLTVVGLAATAYVARYALEVSGQGPSGANRTTQGGATVLKPNERVALLTITLGTGGAGRWHAALVVTPAEGAPYRQERASGTAGS